MHVDVIESLDRFVQIRPDWEAVYDADPQAQFFLSWDWMARIFDYLPNDWRILAVKPTPDDSRYVAFFPLRVSAYLSKRHQVFCNEIHMAGRAFWSDYTGFLCMPEHETQALPALAEATKQLRWAELSLENLCLSNQRINLFMEAFDGDTFRDWVHDTELNEDNINNDVSPYVELPDNFEAYLQDKLSTNTRQKMRRFMRKVESSPELRITVADATTYERDIDILIDMWSKTWADRKGDRLDFLRRRHRVIMRSAFEAGVLYMPVLWNGDQPVGALFSLIDRRKKTLLFKVAGRDETFNDPPPGLVLHGHSIRWAIDNGLRVYDFLRGDEPYKYSYGATDRYLKSITVQTLSRKNLHEKLDPLSVDEVIDSSMDYMKSKQWSKAEAGYRQVLELQPDHSVALTSLVPLLMRGKHFDEARQLAERYVNDRPTDAAAWRLLGSVHLASRDFVSAEAVYRKMIERNPTIGDHFCLGCALQNQGRHAEAVNELMIVLSARPATAMETALQKNAKQLLTEMSHA